MSNKELINYDPLEFLVYGVENNVGQIKRLLRVDPVDYKLLVKDSGAALPALGQATMANSLPVVIASNQSAVPVSATQLPAALGQNTMANSMTVVIASNQTAVPVTISAGIVNLEANVYGAAAGGLQVIAATVGKKHRINQLFITADVPCKVTGSDSVLTAGVNIDTAGIRLDYGSLGGILTGTANTAFTLTSGVAANLGVVALYDDE